MLETLFQWLRCIFTIWNFPEMGYSQVMQSFHFGVEIQSFWEPPFQKKKHYLNGPHTDVGFQCQDLLIRNLPFLSLFNHMIFKQVIGYLMRYWYQCIRIKLTAPIIWLMSRHVQIKPQVIRSCSCCLGTGGQVLHPSSKNRSYSCSVSQQFAWWVHK